MLNRMVSCSRSEKLLVFPQLRQSSTVKGRTWHKLMTLLVPFSNTAKSPCGPLPKNWLRSSVLWPATLEQKKKPNCIMIKICSVKICCRRHYCVISILWQLENVWWTKICFWLVRLSFSSPAISPLKWHILLFSDVNNKSIFDSLILVLLKALNVCIGWTRFQYLN